MEGGEPIASLLCQESKTVLDQEQEVVDEEMFIDITSVSCDDLDSEEAYAQMLVQREISFGFKRDHLSSEFHDWVKFARLDAISWILNSRAIFGFTFQTAYLSMTYFDRFLSRRSIDSEKSWQVTLLSVACLSLAAKMEEIKVPSLSEFQIEEYNFESGVIQRMELLVLNTLEWKMISITPFAFLHYFIEKFCKESRPNLVVSRTVGFILALMREINLLDHRPSTIAAAATLMALDQSLTRQALECKMNSISYSGFLEIENVFECYNVMQKLEIQSLKTPAAQLKTMDVVENSSITISTKRKRHAFSNSDQKYGFPADGKQQQP